MKVRLREHFKALGIEPDEPVDLETVRYDPTVETDRQCDRAEPYFQVAMYRYHYGETPMKGRRSTRVGATAIFHGGLGIGVLKNYEEPTMLCTQTVRGPNNDMIRGWLYSVSENVKQHASQEFGAATVEHVKYSRSRPLQTHGFRRISSPESCRDLKTLDDLLYHADRFIADQRAELDS